MMNPALLDILQAVFQLDRPLPADESRLRFEIADNNVLHVVAAESGTVFLIMRQRPHRDHPSRQELLQTAHFAVSSLDPLCPVESPDGSFAGYGVRLPDSMDRPLVEAALEALLGRTELVFRNAQS